MSEPFNYEDDTKSFLPARVETTNTLSLCMTLWFFSSVAWAIAICVVVGLFVTN